MRFTTSARQKFLTLAFSGGGHLLPYHLGVSKSLLHKISSPDNFLPVIKSVSGSSAGAIAAAIFYYLPHRMEEYTERFMTSGGKAHFHLSEMLQEEEEEEISNGNRGVDKLYIATTICEDGSPFLFSFGDHDINGDDNTPKSSSPLVNQRQQQIRFYSGKNTTKVLKCIKASCHIPHSFHPVDILPNFLGGGGGSISYPTLEGMEIDGLYHVDGAIASPAPYAPFDETESATVQRIVISPISFSGGGGIKDVQNTRISPSDTSTRLLPLRNITCRGGFKVKPSVQNLRSLITSMGVVSSKEDLGRWYERGLRDGNDFCTKYGFGE